MHCRAVACPTPSHPTPPRAPPAPPGVTFGHSELLGQFHESAWFTELAEEFQMPFWYLLDWYTHPIPTSCVITAEPVKVFVCAHFDPFRSENKSIEWTVVTNRTDSVNSVANRTDSVNSVDIPYMDMSEFSKLYLCQVYKYWNVELQNVNISKYPWPLDGIIICITLVTLLFLYVFFPFVHLFLL